MNNININFIEEYKGFINTLTPRILDLHVNSDAITAKTIRYNLNQLLTFLKYDLLHRIKSLLEITAYDIPGKIFRFTLVYSIISPELNTRYQIYTQTDQFLGIETITSIYSAAN